MTTAHIYYFAIRPPPSVAPDIANATGRPCAALHRLHVSLHSLGVRPGDLDDEGWRAADVVATVRRPPFVVAFNRLAAFGRGERRILVLRGDEGVVGVDLLRKEIHAALAAAGLAPRHERPFEAHLTLARDQAPAPEAFVGPVAWAVREFVLLRSYVGQGRHEVLRRFPLKA